MSLTTDQIENQLSAYGRGVVPQDAVVLTQGIEVAKLAIYWVVRAWRADGTGQTVDYGIIEVQAGEREGLSAALSERKHAVELRPYLATDGEPREISLTLVNSTLCRELVHKWCEGAGPGYHPQTALGGWHKWERDHWLRGALRLFEESPAFHHIYASHIAREHNFKNSLQWLTASALTDIAAQFLDVRLPETPVFFPKPTAEERARALLAETTLRLAVTQALCDGVSQDRLRAVVHDVCGELEPSWLELALTYPPGDPQKAQIVNVATGEFVKHLVDFSIDSKLRELDRLTLTVLVFHPSPLK